SWITTFKRVRQLPKIIELPVETAPCTLGVSIGELSNCISALKALAVAIEHQQDGTIEAQAVSSGESAQKCSCNSTEIMAAAQIQQNRLKAAKQFVGSRFGANCIRGGQCRFTALHQQMQNL